MVVVICLDREDIATSIVGKNYSITTGCDIHITLTPEAIEEINRDVEALGEAESIDGP